MSRSAKVSVRNLRSCHDRDWKPHAGQILAATKAVLASGCSALRERAKRSINAHRLPDSSLPRPRSASRQSSALGWEIGRAGGTALNKERLRPSARVSNCPKLANMLEFSSLKKRDSKKLMMGSRAAWGGGVQIRRHAPLYPWRLRPHHSILNSQTHPPLQISFSFLFESHSVCV